MPLKGSLGDSDLCPLESLPKLGKKQKCPTTFYIFSGVAHNALKWAHSGAISLLIAFLPFNDLIQPIGLLIKHLRPLVCGIPIQYTTRNIPKIGKFPF